MFQNLFLSKFVWIATRPRIWVRWSQAGIVRKNGGMWGKRIAECGLRRIIHTEIEKEFG
jgi:hypothetical protein